MVLDYSYSMQKDDKRDELGGKITKDKQANRIRTLKGKLC